MLEDSAQVSGGEEHDVDAILASAYGDKQNPRPEADRPAASSPAPAEVPQFKEYEFNSRGQAVKIRENDPRFQQWLSQGHDYSNQVGSLKAERQAWEEQRAQAASQFKEYEQKFAPYREIDAYAAENPEWWSHVDQSYRERLSNQQGVPDSVKQYLDTQFAPLKDDIPLMKQFLQEMQTQKMEKQQADEDAKLSEAMKSIQDKYKDLDFKSKDESGMSLEARVLDHAVKNGFNSFRSAFLDYYHDDLEKMAEARGRESIAREAEKRRKLGLLDDHPAPSRTAPTPPANFGNGARPRSWNDSSLSSDAILREFKFA